MPEIIDQANELAERRLGAGNWWRVVSAALIAKKSLKNVVST